MAHVMFSKPFFAAEDLKAAQFCGTPSESSASTYIAGLFDLWGDEITKHESAISTHISRFGHHKKPITMVRCKKFVESSLILHSDFVGIVAGDMISGEESKKAFASNMSVFGQPSLFGCVSGGWRMGRTQTPLMGLPTLFRQSKGYSLVGAWPLAAQFRTTAVSLNSDSWFGGLNGEAVTKFCSAHARCMVLQPEDCMYIPAGWGYFVMGVPIKGCEQHILQSLPLMSQALLGICEDISTPTWMDDLKETCREQRGSKYFAGLSDVLLHFLDDFLLKRPSYSGMTSSNQTAAITNGDTP